MNEQEVTAVPDRPRLKKLVIHRYRHVKPGTTLEFDDTWNVIVGKNGTGKTTLLKLIEKLLVYRASGLDRDPFSVDLEMSIGGGTLKTHMEWNCSATIPSNILPGDDLDLKVVGSFEHGSHPVRWKRDPFATTTTVEANNTQRFHSRPYLPPQMLLGFILPRVSPASVSTYRFDEALGVFDQLVGWTFSRNHMAHAISTSTLGFVPESKRSAFLDGRLDPRASVSWHSGDDSALRIFERLASVGRCLCTLPSQRVDVEDDATTSIHGPPSFTFTRENGSSFGHSDLSFGQKRLLAFLYYLEMNDPILILDELSNGFHRSWIDYAVEQMRTRQNFAATQNPLLLDRIFFHSPEELQRSLIFCREEDGKFVWENAKADEMEDVYVAYQVGLRNVSEVLWRKGLW